MLLCLSLRALCSALSIRHWPCSIGPSHVYSITKTTSAVNQRKIKNGIIMKALNSMRFLSFTFSTSEQKRCVAFFGVNNCFFVSNFPSIVRRYGFPFHFLRSLYTDLNIWKDKFIKNLKLRRQLEWLVEMEGADEWKWIL